MPFIPHTPESLLARADSKNPAATCRGLTSVGRPCRRAIAANVTSRAATGDGIHLPDAYCWQHKEQAILISAGTSPRRFPSAGIAIQERTSVDTIVDRLGLLEIIEEKHERRGVGRKHGHSRPNHASQSLREQSSRRKGNSRPAQARQSNLSLFCCIGVADDAHAAPRPVRNERAKPVYMPSQRPSQPMQEITPSRSKIPSSIRPAPPHESPNHRPGLTPSPALTPPRPSLPAQSSSLTAEFLSLIPHTASPQTSALLLGELAKPPSAYDEAGYIYIFWLTPDILPSTPAREVASSLLSPAPSPSASRSRPALHDRRTSSILESFAVAPGSHSSSTPASVSTSRSGAGMSGRIGDLERKISKKTILLKIGRASNVQRRLNEWTRQCGYDLSLIRYYPYQPSSSSSPSPLSPSPSSASPSSRPSSTTPLKVPHAHKVERLIHLELAHMRATGMETSGGGESGSASADSNQTPKCTRCGAAHREWFAVEASRDGIRGVDEVVRRWVTWSLRSAATQATEA